MLSSRIMRRLASALALALAGLTGCLQDYDARCQVNTDCAEGLVCNVSTQTCRETATVIGDFDGGIDAPLDGPDAAIDAEVDAPIDAASIDAPP